MDIHVLGASFEVKFLDDMPEVAAGTFEGHGAVFSNIDSLGDMIEPGAFAKSLYNFKACGKYPPMRKMHGLGGEALDPIGVWDYMEEDSKGLFVKGRLVGLDTEQGKWNYAQLREGALNGLSMGYRVPPNGSRRGSGKGGEPARYLKQIELKEVSLVDNPANVLATVTAMKSLYDGAKHIVGGIKTIRDFENFLRDAGFSNAAAKSIASGGFKARPEPRDEDGIGDAIAGPFAALAKLIHP